MQIYAKTEAKDSIIIKTKAGEIRCIKAGVKMGFWVGRPDLEEVDFATCEEEIKETNLSQ